MQDSPTTRTKILTEAAKLFARRGYLGTSTREIARAVGISQPSLFYHFKSKTDLALALFDNERERLPSFTARLDLPDASPPVKIFQAFRAEAQATLASPYDVRGFYLTEILEYPEFAEWKQYVYVARNFYAKLIENGIASGDFYEQSPKLVMQVLEATFTQSLHWAFRERTDTDVSEVASVLMRLLMKDPKKIPLIREEADNAMAQKDSSAPG